VGNQSTLDPRYILFAIQGEMMVARLDDHVLFAGRKAAISATLPRHVGRWYMDDPQGNHLTLKPKMSNSSVRRRSAGGYAH
jgi:hypothetical protein